MASSWNQRELSICLSFTARLNTGSGDKGAIHLLAAALTNLGYTNGSWIAVDFRHEPSATQPKRTTGVSRSILLQEYMGGKVASYRVYCLDGAGKVASAEWIDADDDDDAIAIVEQRWHGQKCELWDGKRLVARIDAQVA